MIEAFDHGLVFVVVVLLLASLACITSVSTPEAPPITVPYPTTLVPPPLIVGNPRTAITSMDTPESSGRNQS